MLARAPRPEMPLPEEVEVQRLVFEEEEKYALPASCRLLQIVANFLAGSFSAVSKRNFARKYAFDSIFQALQDLHPFAPLQSQILARTKWFENSAIFKI